jgi:hypothetical protein
MRDKGNARHDAWPAVPCAADAVVGTEGSQRPGIVPVNCPTLPAGLDVDSSSPLVIMKRVRLISGGMLSLDASRGSRATMAVPPTSQLVPCRSRSTPRPPRLGVGAVAGHSASSFTPRWERGWRSISHRPRHRRVRSAESESLAALSFSHTRRHSFVFVSCRSRKRALRALVQSPSTSFLRWPTGTPPRTADGCE